MDKKTIKRLLTYCKPYRFLIMLLTLLSIVSVVFTLLTPVLIGQAIDLLVGKNQVHFQALLNKLIFIGIVILIISLIQWIMGQITNTITYNITNDLRNRVFDQIQVLPLKYIDATSHGDILGRLINDIDLIGQGLLQSFTSLLTGIATIVGTILIMAYIHFSVAVIVVVLTPLSLLVASLIVKRTHSYFQEQLALRGEMNGYCEEMIGNQKIVNIFDYQEQNEEKFNEINERMHKSGVISQFYGALINPITRLVNSIVYAAVGIFGAFQVLNGSFTVGILSSFLTYANQYTKPFNEISSVMSEMQTAIAASQRVFVLLDEETIQELTTSKIIENKQGHIIIDHLNFSYDPSKPLIQDFNYEAKPGTMTAIVGKTGCGKTTLIKLVNDLLTITSGEIFVNGKKIGIESKKVISYLPERTYLDKSMSVKQVLKYFSEFYDNFDVDKAKKLIKDLDLDENLRISKMSKGMQEKLQLILVMSRHAKLYILDEPIGGVDPAARTYILKTIITNYCEDSTLLIATNLISEIENICDDVIFISNGNIILQGNVDEIREEKGKEKKNQS